MYKKYFDIGGQDDRLFQDVNTGLLTLFCYNLGRSLLLIDIYITKLRYKKTFIDWVFAQNVAFLQMASGNSLILCSEKLESSQ